MNKTLLLLLTLGYTTHAWASENNTLDFNRKGFHFGLGASMAIVHMIESDKSTLPLLNLDVGYNFSENFALNITTKNILITGYIGIEAKYYLYENPDTWFTTTALNRRYDAYHKPVYVYGAGIGHAIKNYELELSATGRKKEFAGFLTYKYFW